jgi:general secretion pathway protein A
VLYAETGGVPRKLNTLMNRVMLMGAVEQVDVLDGGLVEAVIADMAGKPFEYEAPMSARAPLMESTSVVEETTVAEEVQEPEADVAVEQPIAEISAPCVAVVEPESVAAPQSIAALYNDVDALAARIGILEQRVSEQDAALRRVLAMMIDWMDKEGSFEARFVQNSRAA